MFDFTKIGLSPEVSADAVKPGAPAQTESNAKSKVDKYFQDNKVTEPTITDGDCDGNCAYCSHNEETVEVLSGTSKGEVAEILEKLPPDLRKIVNVYNTVYNHIMEQTIPELGSSEGEFAKLLASGLHYSTEKLLNALQSGETMEHSHPMIEAMIEATVDGNKQKRIIHEGVGLTFSVIVTCYEKFLPSSTALKLTPRTIAILHQAEEELFRQFDC